jgi:phosphoadenosine phosphosulfate reductase
LPKRLLLLEQTFPGKVTFSTSFSYEDQIITDLIQKACTAGFHFYAGYRPVVSRNLQRVEPHQRPLRHPCKTLLSRYGSHPGFVASNGPNAFYESIDLRKGCCFIRKVEPLKRALAGNAVWITGLRAEHSAARQSLDVVEWDEATTS